MKNIFLKDTVNKKLIEITNSLYDLNYEKMSISLFEGISGISYFFFEKITSGFAIKKDMDFFLYLIELLVDKLNKENYSLTYCDGLCGVAFVLKKYEEILKQQDYDIEELLLDIDGVLLKGLEKMSEKDEINTDFLHGSFGLLYYFIVNKDTHPKFKALYIKNIHNIISYINKAKSSDVLNINYGLAHGLCAVINVVKLYLENIDTSCETSKFCLELCCEMFTSPDINYNQSSLYPSISPIKDFNTNASKHPVHLGWCYGDQTISSSLYRISKFQKNTELNQFSRDIANHWVKRNSIEKALLNANFYDCMICHGVGGVALYNKVWFRITGDETFYQNYLYFMNVLLAQEQDSDNIAGYKRAVITNVYEKSYGILTGVAGIGLLLLDTSSMERMSWYDLFII